MHNMNAVAGVLDVKAKEAKERIKDRSRISIQEGLPQPRLADVAYRQILPLVPGITETGFPVPSIEIIAEFSHLSPESDVEETIPVRELFTSLTSVVDAAKPNSGSHGSWDSVNNQSRVSNCERIKRIRDWHTDTRRAKPYVSPWNLERIRHKRNSCQGRIEKR